MAVKAWVEQVVSFGLVPALLLIGFLAAAISAGQAYPRARPAAYGGFWAGVLAVAILVLVLSGTDLGAVPYRGPRVVLIEFLSGAAMGAWTTLGYIFFRDRAWIAIPLALQAAGSLSMLYLFVVWDASRPHIAWVVVSLAPVATLFYTLFRDRPPKPRRSRERKPVAPRAHEAADSPDLPGATTSDGSPDAPS